MIVETARKPSTPQGTVGLRAALDRLYNGHSASAVRFRFGLLTFDLLTIAFFIVASMLPPSPWLLVFDHGIALVLMADFGARLWLERRKLAFLFDPVTLADLIVIATLLAAAFVENWAFLRVLRALRLLRSYHVIRLLRRRYPFFARNQDVIESILNLAVFLFVITALVYVFQHNTNPHIESYIDALYFTVTTPDHDWLRRYHASGKGWSPAGRDHHDCRRQPVLAAGPGDLSAPEGALHVSRLWTGPTRSRRRPL
jgi:voltage-gated potassium channel